MTIPNTPVRGSPILETRSPVQAIALAPSETSKGHSVAVLTEAMGPLARWSAKRHASHKASLAVRALDEADFAAETELGLTALELAKRKAMTMLLARSMVSLTTIATSLNLMAHAADEEISDAKISATIGHLIHAEELRTDVASAAKQLDLTSDERAILIEMVNEQTRADIARTQHRAEATQAMISSLYDSVMATFPRNPSTETFHIGNRT
jgi:hypothetical protein